VTGENERTMTHLDSRGVAGAPAVQWPTVNPVTDEQPPPRPARTAPPRGAAATSRSRVKGAVPATGAWRDGDDAGNRRFADVGTFDLEAGGRLTDVRVAYETWGTLAPDGSNAVLVLHALTGDSHVTGPAGPGHVTAGWWQQLVGPGAPIDTERWFVVAPNVLGGCQGTTGPASPGPDGAPWGSRFPRVTARDQVAVEIELARTLGIRSWALVVGASMGGHRVLEWAVLGPEAGVEVESIAPIATSAQTTGDQIAWAHPQIGAVHADPRFRGGDYYDAADGDGPHLGLGLARQIAHATYRSAHELDARFGRLPQGGEDPFTDGRYAVQSYLDHHGDKLARRFDANSYVLLTQSMLTHDLGRDRGGVEAALATITAHALVVAVDTDRLFLPADSARIAAGIPRAEPLRTLRSDYGHDGFLIEHEQLGPIMADFLADRARSRG
jgi:homoserine O-acetyltransferase/O-succinyltransferase